MLFVWVGLALAEPSTEIVLQNGEVIRGGPESPPSTVEQLVGKSVRVQVGDVLDQVRLDVRAAGYSLGFEAFDSCPTSCREDPDEGWVPVRHDGVVRPKARGTALSADGLAGAVPASSPWRFRFEIDPVRRLVVAMPTHVRDGSGWRQVTPVLETRVSLDLDDEAANPPIAKTGPIRGKVELTTLVTRLLAAEGIPIRDAPPSYRQYVPIEVFRGLPERPTAREILLAGTAADGGTWGLSWGGEHYCLLLFERGKTYASWPSAQIQRGDYAVVEPSDP